MAETENESILIISDDSDSEGPKNGTAPSAPAAPEGDTYEPMQTRLSKAMSINEVRRNNLSRKSTAKGSVPSMAASVRNQQAMKRLRRLAEITDTKFMKDFNPETSKREKNKLKKFPEYSGYGKTHETRSTASDPVQDLCDCLRLTCCGCFFPCPKCSSTKCGTKCRVMRKWMYESVVFDGADESLRNPLLYKVV
ncbi:ARL14 effector protein-like [Lutzomyia longipalpis]|uniref:ARF7 effector protein C-terminal domain-containing protein n=1 Tax=Lutzomyia longipalpis TaxID=7200 RepID=A0A1B0CU19_LUTLO|nr:ARL14 effector protein-like [Lutzomyia longipalpis]